MLSLKLLIINLNSSQEKKSFQSHFVRSTGSDNKNKKTSEDRIRRCVQMNLYFEKLRMKQAEVSDEAMQRQHKQSLLTQNNVTTHTGSGGKQRVNVLSTGSSRRERLR